MLDFLAGAAEAYILRISKMRDERAAELTRIKSLIRTNPEEVEAWFDTEIEKLDSMDVKKLLKDATAGI